MLRSVNRAAVLALFCSSAMAAAQAGRVYTDADYAQAEKFMDYNLAGLVYHTLDQPAWLADGRLWYRDAGPDGVTYMLVDPAKRTKAPAFDQSKLAAGLTALVGSGRRAGSQVPTLQAGHLPIDDLTLEDGDRAVLLTIGAELVRCDLRGAGACQDVGKAVAGLVEPWVRDVASGRDTQLTTDGVTDFGYATDNAGWTHSANPILLWSPDSKKIATFQQDQRKTGEMYLVKT
jgi:dipeptidyl-peptidase-4